jgi:hypothetical protein
VTPQNALLAARVPLVITHAPGTHADQRYRRGCGRADPCRLNQPPPTNGETAMKIKLATAFLMTSALAVPAQAEMLSVVGSWSNLPLHRQYEAPFWNEIPARPPRAALSRSR